MYRVISFYDRGRNIREYLVEHINKMLSMLDSSKSIIYGDKLLRSSLEYLVFEEGAGDICVGYRDLLELSIILHDIGKAFYPVNTGSGYVSFSGHEILSTIITYKLVEEYITYENPPVRKELFLPIIYSIMFHHHALGFTRRYRGLNRVVRYMAGKSVEIIGNILSDYQYVSSKSYFVRGVLGYLDKTLTNMADSIRGLGGIYAYIDMVFGEVKKALLSSRVIPLKKLMHLTLASLVCLDYEAAYSVRRGARTIFGSSCSVWRKYYL